MGKCLCREGEPEQDANQIICLVQSDKPQIVEQRDDDIGEVAYMMCYTHLTDK